MATPEEICALFTDIAQNAQKCIDFDITHWIKKYDLLRKEIKFAEVAMVIFSAAQIYGRKVDYIEEFIQNWCKALKDQDQTQNSEKKTDDPAAPNRPRRRAKRLRPEMLSEKLIRTEYVVKEFKSVPLAKVTEKVNFVQDSEFEKPQKQRNVKSDVAKWKINFPDETGKTKPRPHQLKMEVEELFSRYTNFGKTYLLDYEDDDILGIKKDFKCFSGYIDSSSQALLSDMNLKKFYKNGAQMSVQEEYSLNQECDHLEDCRGGSPERTLTEELPVFQEKEPEMPSFDSGIVEDEDLDFSNELDLENIRLSIDEGIETGSKISEIVSAIEMDRPISPIPTIIPEKENIDLPEAPKIIQYQPTLVINFLKIPEKKLRRPAQFKLPDDMIPKKVPKPEKPPPEPRKFKFLPLLDLTQDLSGIPTPPSTPRAELEEEPDFLGFDESEINPEDILTSTLRLSLSANLNESLEKIMKSRKQSQDSGFMSPSLSLRFSCDDQMSNLDMDSGIGNLPSDLGDLSQINLNPSKETTLEPIPEVPETEAEPSSNQSDTESQMGDEELSDRHKKLQEEAGKRHQEKLKETREVTIEVNQWHSYLKPILKESHSRANFDIHELGTEILNGFVQNYGNGDLQNKIRSFEEIIQGKPKPDICRYFLSTLLLANTKNVQLELEKTRDQKGKGQVLEFRQIKLKFLSSERHHKEMEQMYDESGQINNKKRSQQPALEMTPPKKVRLNKSLINTPSSSDSGYMSLSQCSDDSLNVSLKRPKSVDGVRKKLKAF